MPGTRWPVWKATCSVSAKKLVGFPLSTSVPMICTGASSSGTILVGSSRSMPSNASSGVSGKTWMPRSHSGKGAVLDGVVQVAAVEVGVDARGDLCLLPGQGVHAEPRLPVELDQHGLALVVHQPEGVDAEAPHRPVAARDAPVAHVPDRVV